MPEAKRSSGYHGRTPAGVGLGDNPILAGFDADRGSEITIVGGAPRTLSTGLMPVPPRSSANAGGFEDAVTPVLLGLLPGEVVTYGDVAEEAGHPGAARAVGNILARSDGLPWWRVVSSTGRLVPGHEAEHAQRLRAEGIRVSRGKVARQQRAGWPHNSSWRWG